MNYLDSAKGFKDDIKSEPTEKEENVKKYCLCRKPEQHPMIGCDFCEEWYHNSCLNLTKEDIKELAKTKWKCPKCDPNVSIRVFKDVEDINEPELERDPLETPTPEKSNMVTLSFQPNKVIYQGVLATVSETFFLYFNWNKNVLLLEKIIHEKLKFQTILLPYKKLKLLP